MRRFLFMAVAGWLALTGQAAAHPHAFIDFSAQIKLDAEKQVTAVSVNWIFDEFYTAFILDEIAADGTDPQQGLLEVARINLTNLQEFGYFADLRADGVTLGLQAVEHFETGVEDSKIWLKFDLAPAEPVDPRAQAFTYALYDPTYYVEVLHVEGHVPEVIGDEACTARVDEPNPTAETVQFAYSLGIDEEAPSTLGALFAQTAVLTCE